MLRFLPILLPVAAALPSSAFAQSPQTVDLTNRLTAIEPAPPAKEIAPHALALLKARAKATASCVPRALKMGLLESALLAPMVIQGLAARQARNGWTATARLQGCDGALPARFLILRRQNGKLDVQFVAFGEGIAIPLQQDLFVTAAFAAFTVLSAGRSDCQVDSLRFESTHIVSRSSDLGPDFHGTRFHGSWEEGWRFSGCGRQAEAVIGFSTDGEGHIQWSVDPNKTRLFT